MSERGPRLSDFERAYRDHRCRPSEVCQRTIAAIARADRDAPPLRAVIRTTDDIAVRDAEASDERWQTGVPLSPLDGIPVLVKDNTDVAGVPTSNGSVFELPVPTRDAWVVERVRRLGAIIVGKANLHEIGAGTTGINPHHGTPRNPHDVSRWCGGSSSGSAAAVAAGLVPLSIATDAGGSVRAPAAFVGAVGLKPTFGRISRRGMSILCDTMDHFGPIAHDVAGVTTALCLMADRADDDDETWDQPLIDGYSEALAAIEQPLTGLRIGVCRSLFDHPWIDGQVAERMSAVADLLGQSGAEIRDFEVPELEKSLLVGLVLIGAEGPAGLEHILLANRHRLGVDLRVLLESGDHLLARDYLKAQRMRQAITRGWRAAMQDIDAVLMPATGTTAQTIRPDALHTGELDDEASARAIGCTIPSNLTGFPAVSVPCGWIDHLPVSAQIVARPWHEIHALRVARHIERSQLFTWRRPRRYFGDDIVARR